MQYYTIYQSILGSIVLTSDSTYLTGLYLENNKHIPSLSNFKLDNNLEIFKQTINWLQSYFNRENPPIKIPLKVDGSQLFQSVIEIIKDIPYGTTLTYKDIATKLNTAAYRAIGNSVGKNPISLIIPCHRVIGSSNHLTGYASGLELKEYLLTLEGHTIKNHHLISK